MYKLYKMSQNMAINSCLGLYFRLDIGSERILQICSQTCDRGRQFATKQHWNFHLALAYLPDTLCKAGSNCGKTIKLSFLNMQIFHHTKLLLLGPNCEIIRLFLRFNIYVSVHQFSRHISKSKKMLPW